MPLPKRAAAELPPYCPFKVRCESLEPLTSSAFLEIRRTGSAEDLAGANLVGARARALFVWNERARGRSHACRPREVHARLPCSCSACSPRPLTMHSQERRRWELVDEDRLRQALPSGWQHALGRLSTGCNLSRVAAGCESRARSCGVDIFYGAYHARWKRSKFASLQSPSGPQRGAHSVKNSKCKVQSPYGGGRSLAGGIIGDIMVAPKIFVL